MCTVRYVGVRERQPAPYATLSQGGAGIAYALWRLGETGRASAWLGAALRDRRPGRLDPSLSKRSRRSSMLFGLAGIRWAHALVAGGQRIDAYIRETSGLTFTAPG